MPNMRINLGKRSYHLLSYSEINLKNFLGMCEEKEKVPHVRSFPTKIRSCEAWLGIVDKKITTPIVFHRFHSIIPASWKKSNLFFFLRYSSPEHVNFELDQTFLRNCSLTIAGHRWVVWDCHGDRWAPGNVVTIDQLLHWSLSTGRINYIVEQKQK